MPNLSLAQIAKDWGTSRTYVHQCVAKGCPKTTLQEARIWRDQNARSKAPTDPAHVKVATLGNGPKIKKKAVFSETVKTGDTLLDFLTEAVERAEVAHRLAKEAMVEEKDALIAARLSVANKASDQRMKAEVQYRQEMERRRDLIPLNSAQDMALRGFSKLLNSLQRLPQQIAQRLANRTALEISDTLTVEVNAIIADSRKAYEL